MNQYVVYVVVWVWLATCPFWLLRDLVTGEFRNMGRKFY